MSTTRPSRPAAGTAVIAALILAPLAAAQTPAQSPRPSQPAGGTPSQAPRPSAQPNRPVLPPPDRDQPGQPNQPAQPAQPNQPGQPDATPANPNQNTPDRVNPGTTGRVLPSTGARALRQRFFQLENQDNLAQLNDFGQRLARFEQQLQQRNQLLLRQLGQARQLPADRQLAELADVMQGILQDQATMMQIVSDLRASMTGDLTGDLDDEGNPLNSPQTDPSGRTNPPDRLNPGVPTTNPREPRQPGQIQPPQPNPNNPPAPAPRQNPGSPTANPSTPPSSPR